MHVFYIAQLPTMWMFTKPKTGKSLLNENKRSLDKSLRELARQCQTLILKENKCIVEIKRNAEKGDIRAVKRVAADLIRIRNTKEHFHVLESQLHAASTHMLTASSNCALGDAMRGMTLAMRSMNTTMNLPCIAAMVRDFDRQNQHMEMSAEIINDGMNDATETDSQNEETDKLVSQILDELGCNLRSVLEDAPMGQGISNTTGADLDIRARLDVLKKFDT